MKTFYSFIVLCFIPCLVMSQYWQPVQNIPAELTFPVVVSLRGNIHIMGGGAAGGATDLHLRYTPATDTWDTMASVPYLAQQPAGAVVNDKIHYCGGGYPNTGSRLDLHYYYDPDSNQWYQAANMPVATAIHEAVGFDGKLYCLSGQPDKTLCEYYDPLTNSWTQKNALPDQNFWYGAIVATSDAIYRFGGGGYTSPSNKAHRYDKNTDSWVSLPNLPLSLHALAGININDDLICISGGYLNASYINKVWIYHVNTLQYIESDTFLIGRCYHSMSYADSCLYSVGGNNPNDPAIGVSLLKNCDPSLITSVKSLFSEQKPYTLIMNQDQLTINWNGTSVAGQFSIKLVDIQGRTILETKSHITDHSYTINGKLFNKGTYLVLIQTVEKTYIEKWNVIH